jgi:hypothetical protein
VKSRRNFLHVLLFICGFSRGELAASFHEYHRGFALVAPVARSLSPDLRSRIPIHRGFVEQYSNPRLRSGGSVCPQVCVARAQGYPSIEFGDLIVFQRRQLQASGDSQRFPFSAGTRHRCSVKQPTWVCEGGRGRFSLPTHGARGGPEKDVSEFKFSIGA